MRHAETDTHIAFRASSEDARALRRIALDRGITLSALMREAVAVLVETEADERPTLDQLSSSNVFIRRAQRR